MKFPNLEASIGNNAGEEPTVYMALCMVDSLFRDVKEAAGQEVYACPAGDETLPTKMVWLGRMFRKIYEGQDVALERNRKRLDDVMAESAVIQRKLETLAPLAAELCEKEKELDQLREKLAKAESAQQTCQELERQCGQVEEELQQLGAFDAAEAERRLDGLRQMVSASRRDQQRLTDELREEEDCAGSLESALKQLEEELARTRKDNENLTGILAVRKSEQEHAVNQRAALERQALQAKDELADLVRQRDRAKQDATDIAVACQSFRDSELAAARREQELAESELTSARVERARLEQQARQLGEQRDTVIRNISSVNQTISAARTALEKKQEEFLAKQAESRAAQEEVEGLEAELHQQTELLCQAQDQVSGLEDELASVLQLLQEETNRRGVLDRKLEETLRKKEDAIAKCRETEKSLIGKEEELLAIRETYSTLTAEYAAKSEELDTLKKQLQELQDKNDAEKMATYQSQLKRNLEDLETLSKRCGELSEDVDSVARQLEEEQGRYEELTSRRQALISAREKIAVLKEGLGLAASPHFLLQVQEACDRLDLLENVRQRLAESVALVRETLGGYPAPADLSIAEGMKENLNALQVRTNEMRQALLTCAGSLKLEER